LRKTGSLIAALAAGWLGLVEPSVAQADAPGPTTSSKKSSSAPKKKTASGKKKRARGPVFSGRLARADEMRTEPLEKPSGHIELYAVNFRQEVTVDLYNEDGSFNADAVDKLNHVFRCKRTDTEKAIDPHLYEMLSRVYDKFQKRIELVSGFRNQKRTSSFHFHGSASDIRIPGISDTKLHQFVTSLDAGGMGIGIYPRAGFVHIDIRPEPSFRWVDYSPPGSNEMGQRKKSKAKHVASAPNS
jgi:uncharacterized protein YcbK (DUF882 family)